VTLVGGGEVTVSNLTDGTAHVVTLPDVSQVTVSGGDVTIDLTSDLGPGDALLLPGFWFHAIKLSAPSLSASRFVRSRMPAALGGGPTRPWQEAGPFVHGW
jgi:hypothetical protein